MDLNVKDVFLAGISAFYNCMIDIVCLERTGNVGKEREGSKGLGPDPNPSHLEASAYMVQ